MERLMKKQATESDVHVSMMAAQQFHTSGCIIVFCSLNLTLLNFIWIPFIQTNWMQL